MKNLNNTSIDSRINAKGYSIRTNLGYRNGVQVVASYSAMKNDREVAKASSKSDLLRQLK